jgi:hypothetical protein
MGFKPGPVFSQILRSLEDAQLEGQVQTREEAAQLVIQQFGTNKSRL